MNSDLVIGNFNLVSKLGHGASAKVYKGVGESDTPVALKVQSNDNMNVQMVEKFFDHEIKVHSQLTHPNIVEFIEGENDAMMIKMPTGETRTRSFIATEYCPKGDMFKFVNQV